MTLSSLADVGVATFSGRYVDVSGFYLLGFQRAGFPTAGTAWDSFVESFAHELVAAAKLQGGWAIAGAFHVARDFVKSEDWAKPQLADLQESALRFLAANKVDAGFIPMSALTRFRQLQGG